MGGFRDDSADSLTVSEKRPASADVFAFQPGFVWKAMRTFWEFPDWHAAYLRQFEVLKRVDAKEKETILAERTLGEIRGLLGFVIGCGRLYHPERGKAIGFVKRCALAGQSIFDINARSRNLHDRVANIPSLSGLLIHDCVICSLFNTFRHLIRHRSLDAVCGPPSTWELSLIGGDGDRFIVDLLEAAEQAAVDAASVEGESAHLVTADLRRCRAFILALIDKAAPATAEAKPVIAALDPASENTVAEKPASNMVFNMASMVVPDHLLEIRKECKKKWSDVVQVAEFILARPNRETSGKEMWKAFRLGETFDDAARCHISACVAIIRLALERERNGWEIPKNRYIVIPKTEGDSPRADELAVFLARLKNVDRPT
jgi:hypothetical protein